MTGKLAAALELEHRQIDGGIEQYVAAPGDPSPLTRAMEALRRHIYLEEEFLFPPLKEAGMTMPVFVMVREHGELWDAMDALQGQLGSDAPAETLQNASRELLARLDSHNSKEEPVIYPQADAVLSREANAKLLAFLDEGTLPAGWQCERASR